MYEQTVRLVVGSLRPAEPLVDGALCVVPLCSAVPSTARYVLLEQALSRGTLTVTEVSDAGAVPYLQAVNKGPWPVLIYDGEELVGAKQNRIANTTVLVGVGSTILPVSCVEQGRWSHRSRAFGAGTYASHPGLRRDKERQVRDGMTAAARRERAVDGAQSGPGGTSQWERAQRFASRQGEIWEEVQRVSTLRGVGSPTMALADTFAADSGDLEATLQRLGLASSAAAAGTVGSMVFLGGRFVCLDLLQPAKRFCRLYPKLLRGYALEALLSKTRIPKGFDAEASALRLLAEMLESGAEEHPAADLGCDLRLESPLVSGSGLVWRGELIQLSVFPRHAA